ncbi:hypothetical protein C2L66_39245 [Paraburkholderia caribensis]|nr:hypothetical protein C2L66_39245 [Paraburkholderia caribensis]
MSTEIASAARRTRKGTPNRPIEFRLKLAKPARERIEGTPDAATLRVVLRTLRAAAEAET